MTRSVKILCAVLGAAAVSAVLIFALKPSAPAPEKGGAGSSMEASVREEIHKQFTVAAGVLNKDVPKKLDDVTTLLGAEAGPDLLLTYRYALSGLPGGKEDLSRTAEESRRTVTDKVCRTRDMRDFMEYGAAYRYIYESAAGEELFRFTVDEAACLKHEEAAAGK